MNQMADMMSQLTELSSATPSEAEATNLIGVLENMKVGLDIRLSSIAITNASERHI